MVEHLEMLSAQAHRNVHMRPYVDDNHPHFVPIVIQEFVTASVSCPIFFAKDATTGEFYSAALFGFTPGELLVDSASRGRPTFRPLEMQRQGFVASDHNIAIDTANPRFGSGAALALFEDGGAPSNALRHIQRIIGELAAGGESTRKFIAELLRLRLIEPVDIALSFDDGQSLSLDGLYTVSRDALSGLNDSDTMALFRAGYLQAALCMSASLGQIAILAERRNARLTEKP